MAVRRRAILKVKTSMSSGVGSGKGTKVSVALPSTLGTNSPSGRTLCT
jgi:hypothetical protein